MRKIIIGQPNCSKCNMLKLACPDAETAEPDQQTLLAMARLLGITSIPFVVIAGEPHELETVLKGK